MNPEKLSRETGENGILDRFEFPAGPQGMDCRFFFGLTKGTGRKWTDVPFQQIRLGGKRFSTSSPNKIFNLIGSLHFSTSIGPEPPRIIGI